jgi:hypothetical protein
VNAARKLLLAGGIALLIAGMCYGLWYALFIEHQRLDQVGGALATSFAQAADRNLPAAHQSIESYGAARYLYIREVDAHSHWTGLALLLILLSTAFDRLGLSASRRAWLAWALVLGAAGFPASVLLQSLCHDSLPRLLAAVFAAILIAALAITAWGFMIEKPASL